jgi:uncharacterized protein (TIGR03435 family)
VRTVALLLATAAAYAQPAFEVASIREHSGPLSRIMDYSASGTRLTLGTYPAIGLIAEAFNLEFHQIVVPPALEKVREAYYNITAKAPGDDPASRDDLRRMLQTLLSDRFAFRFHREPKEMPVYVLIVGKGGSKLKPAAEDSKRHARIGVKDRNQFVEATRSSIADLTRHLRDLGADRPILDQTGLTGEYDFRIEAAPRRTPEFGDISVFTAVQEQLGLRLEPRKAPIEVLVVDRFDKPSAN